MERIPDYLNHVFIGLVIFLYLTLIYGVYYGWSRQRFYSTSPKKVAAIVALGIALWLALTGVIAHLGLLSDFTAMPPRFMFVFLPALLVTLYFSFSDDVGRLVNEIPGRALIAIQSFRVIVEGILWLLFMNNALPEIMTFTGRNFDVVIALTAPTIAIFAFKGFEVNKRVVIIWNALGLLALANVITHGILSAPTPLRIFMSDPPNTMIVYYPFVWLPAFVVPCAIFFHLVSIRKTL
ncbi:MAG: hypothetical protein SGI74_04890 [Oligoflexia bacterium]|nr:hypothetical protein [Oligoflexia bacterium]